MSTRVEGLLVAAVGATAVLLVVSGRFMDYLKPGMRWPLLAAGSAMVLLGVLTITRAHRGEVHAGPERDPAAVPGDHGEPGEHGHDHDHGRRRVAWLLALPLVALTLVQPPALGADAARREAEVPPPAPRARGFDPLPAPRDGAVDLTLIDFLTRSYHDRAESLAGVEVRLVGFVLRDPAVPDGYQLTRFRMACCAADAFAVGVNVRGLDAPLPADDTWLEVTGRWIPPEDPGARGVDRGAELTVTGQTPVPPPADPYE